MTRALIRATVIIALVRLLIAASDEPTARFVADPVPEQRFITGCFGRPKPLSTGIRYEPEGLLEVDTPKHR